MQYVLKNDVESTVKPEQEVVYGANGMDFNFNIHEEERKDEFTNAVSIFYKYDTYRFKDKSEYYAWKHEQELQAILDVVASL